MLKSGRLDSRITLGVGELKKALKKGSVEIGIKGN
jgi:hypothetical protein